MQTKLLSAALSLSLLIAASASAQNNRSFVATYGSDANDCSAGHECRSFTRALSVTNFGGEVVALTSGGYGPFTVTQSVSVVAATGAASITAPVGVHGVEVAAFSTDRILLRGLNITVSGTASNGIYATGFGLLTIDHCTMIGGAGGVVINGDTSSRATIADTTVIGASAAGFSFTSRAILTRCRAEKNSGTGIDVSEGTNGSGRVTATEFVSNGNQNGARSVSFTSGHFVSLTVDRSVFSDNALDGLFCNAGGGGVAYIFIGNSVVTDNGQYGLNPSTNGTMWSMKNNLVVNNQTGDQNTNNQPVQALPLL